MEAYILLLLLLTTPLLGMDSMCIDEEQFPQESTKTVQLERLEPHLWLNLVKLFFKTESLEEAAKDTKAWCLTTKASTTFFKNTRYSTSSLIRLIQEIGYQKDEDEVSIIASLKPLFAEDEYTRHETHKAFIEDLLKTITNCARTNNWQEACIKAHEIKEKNIAHYLNNYYVYEQCLQNLAKKTVLVHTLELDAPDGFIKILITCGVQLTNLHPQTPPPLFILCQKSIASTTQLSFIQGPTETKNSSKKLENYLTYLKNLMKVLHNAGASLNDSFLQEQAHGMFSKRTPLFLAVILQQTALVHHLLFLGALPSPMEILISAQNYIHTNSEKSYTIFKMLLNKAKDAELILDAVFSHLFTQQLEPDQRKRALKLVKLINKKTIAFNRIKGGKTVLDRAQLFSKKGDLIALLTTKGAKPSPTIHTQNENKAWNIFKDLVLLARGQTAMREDAKRLLLKESLELLSTSSASKTFTKNEYDFLLKTLFLIALEKIPLSPETKEFLVYLDTLNEKCSAPEAFYEPIPSVFHGIVTLCSYKKQRNSEEYTLFVTTIRPLILELAQKGVTDKKYIQKTAATRAQELGLEEIAHLIQEAVHTTQIKSSLS